MRPYFEKMDYLYNLCDLVVARSGATTLSELMVFNKKAILIPFPYAKDNHQLYNAQFYEELGLGRLLPEKNLNLAEIIKNIDLLKNSAKKALPELPDTKKIILEEIYKIITRSLTK